MPNDPGRSAGFDVRMLDRAPMPGEGGNGNGHEARTSPVPASRVFRVGPTPRRPKGRWLVGVVLFGACATAGAGIWHSFFRYTAHGVVTTLHRDVAATVDAPLRSCDVVEGEAVAAGRELFALDDFDLVQQQAAVADERAEVQAELERIEAVRVEELARLRAEIAAREADLRVAQAEIPAVDARLRWDRAHQAYRYQDAVGEYYELQARALDEEARLGYLQRDLGRVSAAERHGWLVSQREVDRAATLREAQDRMVEQLRTAVAEREKRVALSQDLLLPAEELRVPARERVAAAETALAEARARLARCERDDSASAPVRARIARLEGELERLRERQARTAGHAPAAGIVLRRLRLPGEFVHAGDPIVTLQETGTVEVVLYVPQEEIAAFEPGTALRLVIQPERERLRATVAKIGVEQTEAPPAIAVNYRARETLVPVFLIPDDPTRPALRAGAVVRLERNWP